jgi:hydrogenase large subunit
VPRLVVGPFNRVEGDLEVTIEVADGAVREARVNSPLYRGFEQLLVGRDPLDALVFAPRICGICSVSQSHAAARALAQLADVSPPPNGRLAQNLALGCENLADHLTHFYLFFMPDFARECYAGRRWHKHAQARFRATRGEGAAAALAIRARLLNLMGYLAGKWPHTLALQPGGSAKPVEVAERLRMLTILHEFRAFLERQVFGDRLETVGELASESRLAAWARVAARRRADFPFFLQVAADCDLAQLGRASDVFMSYGAYHQEDGPLFPQGIWDGSSSPLTTDAIAEDISHSWMMAPQAPLHPREGMTVPDADKAAGYSWCKAPRLGGRVVETGALARQVVAGHPLVRDLVARSGGNVRNRVIARVLEIALVVPQLEKWVRALEPDEPWCTETRLPYEGRAEGLTEAARGSLGHWLEVKRGRIHNYQIIAPTTWNFSPRDAEGIPGALEQALVGTPVEPGETTPVAVQHVVRSFDPCMVCTVH